MNINLNLIKLATFFVVNFSITTQAKSYKQHNCIIRAQTAAIDSQAIYAAVAIDTKPQFIGGDKALQKYLKRHFHLSQTGIAAGVKGRVILSFVVERDGSLSSFKILRDLNYGTGEEAIRVLKVSPRWQAGKHKGVVVRSNFTLAVPVNI
jgi:protein TonB